MKFNKKRLLPLCNFLYKKGYQFNILIFYIDVFVWAIPFSILYIYWLLRMFN